MCLKGNIPSKSPYIVRHMTPLSSNFDVSSGRSKPTRWSTAMFFFESIAFAMLAHWNLFIIGHVFGRKTTCSTLYLVLEADSKNWNNDRQKWLNQNELKEFSPGWSSVLKKLLPHTFAPPQTTLFIVHRCLKRQPCNMHLIEVFQLCWSCPTCVIPADVPRSGSARQPASSGFCVTRGL